MLHGDEEQVQVDEDTDSEQEFEELLSGDNRQGSDNSAPSFEEILAGVK